MATTYGPTLTPIRSQSPNDRGSAATGASRSKAAPSLSRLNPLMIGEALRPQDMGAVLGMAWDYSLNPLMIGEALRPYATH